MECPKCKSPEHVGDGIVRNGQRYRCKSCGYRYTVAGKSDVKPSGAGRPAPEMYLEGLGSRSIGRILKIGRTAVHYRVKKWGEEAELPVGDGPAEIAGLDEMHGYAGQKKPLPDMDCR